MYYIFDDKSECICRTVDFIDFGVNHVVLESEDFFNIDDIELVNGGIQKKVIPEPTEEEHPLVVEDEYEIDERSVDILSAIAELSEAILELQGGNNL